MHREQLQVELKSIQSKKRITNVSFVVSIACIVFFFVLKSFGISDWFKPIYQLSFVLLFFGFIMLLVQDYLKCPNCKKKFNEKRNGMSYAINAFTSKCLNCGIKANGENISDYE